VLSTAILCERRIRISSRRGEFLICTGCGPGCWPRVEKASICATTLGRALRVARAMQRTAEWIDRVQGGDWFRPFRKHPFDISFYLPTSYGRMRPSLSETMTKVGSDGRSRMVHITGSYGAAGYLVPGGGSCGDDPDQTLRPSDRRRNRTIHRAQANPGLHHRYRMVMPEE